MLACTGSANARPLRLHHREMAEQRDRYRLAGITGATLRLFRHGSPRLTSKPGFEASWCNGAAGAVLLWSKS